MISAVGSDRSTEVPYAGKRRSEAYLGHFILTLGLPYLNCFKN